MPPELDNPGVADNTAPPPPDFAPPPADITPAPAQPTIDYDRLAQANAHYLAPVMQQFAPKPPPAAYEDPRYFAIPAGLDGDAAAKWVHDRVNTVAEARAEAKSKAVADELRREFGAALQGRDQYFAAQYSMDPKFTAIKAHFDKYAQRGYPAAEARYLAERDAGMHAAQSTTGATTTRVVGAPPPHLTTPTGRAGSNAPADGFDPVKFKSDENYRLVRFKTHAAAAGYVQD